MKTLMQTPTSRTLLASLAVAGLFSAAMSSYAADTRPNVLFTAIEEQPAALVTDVVEFARIPGTNGIPANSTTLVFSFHKHQGL